MSQETIAESTTTLPIWAAITIGVGGVVLLTIGSHYNDYFVFYDNTGKNKGK